MSHAALTREELIAEDCRGIVARAGADLESLRNRRVFITGGTGFFGTWLLETLAWANRHAGLNCEAWILTRDAASFGGKAPHLLRHEHFRFVQGDVRFFTPPGGEFHAIVHAGTAASAKLNNENPLEMIDTIVAGTRRVLEMASNCGAARFLFVSSGGVYGRQPPELTHVTEDYAGGPDVTAPRNAYHEAKRLAELLCVAAAARSGFAVKIARCFAFVGPHLPIDAHFAVGNFIRDGLAGLPIVINGDGTPLRSYQYPADLIVWLVAILNRGGNARPYNVGSDEAIAIGELAQTVAGAFSPPPAVEIRRKPAPGTAAERYVPSIARAHAELLLANVVSLRDGIRKTIAWHRARPAPPGASV